MIRYLNHNECKEGLANLGFQLHQGKLLLLDGKMPIDDFNFVQLVTPSQSNEFFNFALRMTDWLPDGEWIAITINSYSHFDAIQQRVLNLLIKTDATVDSDFELYGKVLFVATTDEQSRMDGKIFISCVVYWMLAFEGDCRIVSSASPNGNFISLDDGVAHLALSKSAGIAERKVFESIIKDPTNLPAWAITMISEEQDRFLGIKK